MTLTLLYLVSGVLICALGATFSALYGGPPGQRPAWRVFSAAQFGIGLFLGALLMEELRYPGSLGPFSGALALVAVTLLSVALQRLHTPDEHRPADAEGKEQDTLEDWVEAMPIGVLLSRTRGKSTDLQLVNGALREMLGAGTDLDRTDAAGERNVLHHIVERNQREAVEEQQYILADGRILWLESSTRVDEHPESDTRVTFSVLTDITARKRDEEFLKGRYEQLSNTIDNAEVLLFSTDLRGRVVHANKRSGAFLGRSPDELLGATWFELGFSEHAKELARDVFFATIDGEFESSPAFEAQITRRDGAMAVVAWRCAPVRDEAGSITGATCSGIDVTGRDEAIRRLRYERGRLGSILNTTPIGVLVVDIEGKVIDANVEARDQLNLSPSISDWPTWLEVATFTDWNGNEQPSADGQKLLQTVAAEGHALQELRLARQTENRRTPYLVNLTPLTPEEHGIHGAIVTLQDMTDTLTLSARARRSERLDAIRRLAKGVAHDFNNSLTAIIGGAELALGDEDPELVRHQLMNIRAAAMSAAALTSRLQSMGRTPKQSGLPLGTRELGEVARAAWQQVGLQGLPQIALEQLTDRRVFADSTMLDVTLQALLNNAIEASNAPSDVRLEVSNIGEDRVRFSVINTGEPLSTEVVERMFEPYFSSREGHTGLGLSEALTAVQRFQGEFFVSAGDETEVAFELPLQDSELPEHDTTEHTEEVPSRGTETILVLEDEPDVLDLIKAILERQGYQVRTATSLEQARAFLESDEPFDLWLSDVELPDGLGTDFLSTVRSKRPGCPVLLISGMDRQDIDAQLSQKPYTAFTAKPFTARGLVTAVRAALDG